MVVCPPLSDPILCPSGKIRSAEQPCIQPFFGIRTIYFCYNVKFSSTSGLKYLSGIAPAPVEWQILAAQHGRKTSVLSKYRQYGGFITQYLLATGETLSQSKLEYLRPLLSCALTPQIRQPPHSWFSWRRNRIPFRRELQFCCPLPRV